jgi:hypothetical protein
MTMKSAAWEMKTRQAPNDQPYHPDYFRAPNEFGFNLVCQLGAADLE